MSDQRTSVAIVGANGQVGMELSVLLREAGYTVYPVVRNEIAAATFDAHGFAYRIGEITSEEDAPELLRGVDTVVVAAFAPWFGGPEPKAARRINEAIVQNSLEYSPAESSIVYFSSNVAYGSDIGLSNWHWYGITKRRLESIVEDHCDDANRPWYNLRLGLVHGPNQGFTRQFVGALENRERVYFPVEPDRPANVVHTVTVAETIARCIRREPDSGLYSVVNQPQWTWSDLASQYVPETNTFFRPGLNGGDGDTSLFRNLLGRVLPSLDDRREVLMSLLPYLPSRVSTYLVHTNTDSKIAASIDECMNRAVYADEHLSYDPIPGPHIKVPAAQQLLERETVICDTLKIPDRYSAYG